MRTIVYGNGKSRQKWNVNEKLDNVVTWGCNRIFNDVKVDNLVAVDYHVQHLIYESGYAHENKCWFADWNILPSNVPYMDITFGKNKPNVPIKENDRGDRQNVVVNGKFTKPNEGVFITWVDDNDMVEAIDYPREWSSGTTAIHLACQQGATEIYMLGFDCSDDPKHNVYEREQSEYHILKAMNLIAYEGEKSEYRSQNSNFSLRLDWARELKTVFTEFKNVKFIWAEGENPNRMIDTLNAGELNAVINKSMIGQDRLIFDNDNLTYDTYENIRRNICR